MPWAFSDGHEVAEVTKEIAFHAGEDTFGRFQVTMNTRVNAFYEPDPGKKWVIRPLAADVRVTKQSSRAPLFWASFRPHGSYYVSSGTDHRQASPRQVIFIREFGADEIAAFEEWRDGADVKVQILVHGFGIKGGEMLHRSFDEAETTIFGSQWENLLNTVRFHEQLTIRIPLTSLRVEAAGNRLREAQDLHSRGDYANVMHTCRKALEALGQAGFGRRAPKDINGWIRSKRDIEEQYTLEERTAVLQAAARVLCNTGSHEGNEERRIQRCDADLMLAVTSGLVRAAPHRLANAEATSNEDGEDLKEPQRGAE